jgi:diguanylate cyclase (GGDEF)-like protein
METLDYQDPVEEFKRQVFDLNTMLEIGKTLNASLSLRDVLDIIILTCSGHFHASDAILLLSSEEGGQNYFSYPLEEDEITFGPTHPLIHHLKETQQLLHLSELSKISSLKETHSRFKKDEIELIIPLRFKGQINGILCLKKKEKGFGEEFTEDEIRYIDILAGFASVAIENARLYEMATLDRKTQLYNHGFFKNRLVEEIERAERYKTDLSLIMMDLDHFKNVNDTYGHIVGDDVLIEVAGTIKTHIRSFDIPARFGGEEFTVILPETDNRCALIVAERLRKAVEKLHFNVSSRSFSITVSIGVANFTHSSNITDDMFIEQADRALYYAKQHGRNQVASYETVVKSLEI